MLFLGPGLGIAASALVRESIGSLAVNSKAQDG